MSGFFWNIRGFNKSNKHMVVRDWIQTDSLSFGCLLETRVQENRASSIISSTFRNWSSMTNYEFNTLGRIWVVWKDNVRVTPVFKSGQLITCSVLVDGIAEEFFVSFVYASNSVDERRELWEDIQNHHLAPMLRDKPWLIMGDFNEILDGEEHSTYESAPSFPSGMRDFQNTVRFCSLTDMHYHGPLFTWTNKREEGLISKKLDRVLINEEWNRKFPSSYSVFEPGGCSDHVRCRLNLGDIMPKPRGPFKFSNVLTTSPEFMSRVQEYWYTTPALFHSTSAMFRFSKKLKGLKPILKSLGRANLSNLTHRVDEAFTALCEKQKRSFDDPSPEAIQEENQAFTQWDMLSVLEEGFLRQKSKLHWLKVGDKNNKYFHTSAKARAATNAIREIQCTDGRVCTTQEDIKAEAVGFFETFLKAQPAGETLTIPEIQELLAFRSSEADSLRLIRPVTEEEVTKVLFSMPMNKSPGPDGFTVEFFTAAWSIIGRDFVIAIQSFFLKGFLPKGVNTTILALIPKKTDARTMRDYRPISCCNVLYKVISKILANRLKEILPSSIAPNQSAFIKDRLMMENLLLASELVKDYHKDTVSRRCALKIDISKAFDSVNWSFMLRILKSLELPEAFIHWIELCISTATFSVQVNGELAGFFRSERGLRQGCSLSPYLFVICMNILTRMLDKAATQRRFGYHPRCQNMSLTHLCFADDILVFSDGRQSSVEGILAVFDTFATYSGLNISVEKSTIFMAGIPPLQRDRILQSFPFEMGTLPVRYLGLPLLTKCMTATDYLPLIERIRGRITSWTSRFLSFAGRLQLIKSVLSSLTNFWLAAFRLPSSCIKEIEKLFAAFLWSGPELNGKKAKVAWSMVCRPTQEGGLGLRSLKEVNTVCLLKLIWRLISAKHSLWAKWIHSNLIKDDTLWSVRASSNAGSWMWRKILKYRTIAQSFLHMEINSGTSTSFWYDRWNQLGQLHDRLGSRGFIDLGISSHATVADAMDSLRRRRHRNTILNHIEEAIATVRMRRNDAADQPLWKFNDESFKPKFSSRHTWQQIRESHPQCDWHRGVWFPFSTPKYAFITWLAFHDRLATGDKLHTWNSRLQSGCVFCDEGVETKSHLFFSCPYSSQVWSALARGLLQTHYTTSWTSIVPLLLDTTQPKLHTFTLRYVFQISLHSLWRERNGRRHGESPTPVPVLIRCIDKHVRNRFSTLREADKFEEGLRFWFHTRTL